MINITWNYDELAKLSKPSIERSYKRGFEKAKANLIQSFNIHPVTKGIEGGEDFYGGTLFGFFGFEEGFDPIEPIRAYFEDSVQFDGITVNGKQITVSIDMPSAEDIFNLTADDLPWVNGRSWVKMVETGGVAGVGFYLGEMEKEKGRSKEGIQIKTQIRSGKYGPFKYISDLIKNFTEQLKKIDPS